LGGARYAGFSRRFPGSECLSFSTTDLTMRRVQDSAQ
jgi:hypothetical protein